MPHLLADTSVVILAGGRATRFPGKLLADAGGMSLAVRVANNVRDVGPIVMSVAAGTPSDRFASIDCSVVEDDLPGRGPLEGVVSAARTVTTPWLFVVAGDAPFIESAHLLAMAAQRRPGIEAIVATHGNPPEMQPLCGLYDREALLREAEAELRSGRGAVRAVVGRLHGQAFPFADPLVVASINTPAEYDRYLARALP